MSFPTTWAETITLSAIAAPSIKDRVQKVVSVALGAMRFSGLVIASVASPSVFLRSDHFKVSGVYARDLYT